MWLKRKLQFLPGIFFLLAVTAATVNPRKEDKPVYALHPTSDAYLHLALADAMTLSPFDRPYVRYLTVRDKVDMQLNSLTVNYDTRATTIQRLPPLAGGHLLRVDLRVYAPTLADYEEWRDAWEELAYEPAFSMLVTRGTLNLLAKTVGENFRVRHRIKKTVQVPGPQRIEKRPVEHPGGYYTYPDDSGRPPKYAAAGHYDVELRFNTWRSLTVREWEETSLKKIQLSDAAVLRFNPPGIARQNFVALQEMLQTEAPIVSADYFRFRALSTIKGNSVKPSATDDLFRTIFGGLYYEFAGVRQSKEKGVADLDLWFQDSGVGGKGEKFAALFERLRSDERVGIIHSGVTKKPRVVELFGSSGVRPSDGSGLGMITGDLFDEDIDIDLPVHANLLNPRKRAREAIHPRRGGLNRFGLYNEQGARQDEVPFNVVSTRRLQAAIDCLDCHYVTGSSGWLPLTNDVQKLLGRRLDIIGDLSAGRKAFDVATIDRLFGLYGGNPLIALQRARDDQEMAILRATGPMPGGDGSQADIGRLAHTELVNRYHKYYYSLVTPRQALLELGYEVPEAAALTVFNRLTPPDGRSEVPGGFIPEDPRIGLLKAGLAISRTDFALARSFLEERVQRQVEVYKKRGRTWWGE